VAIERTSGGEGVALWSLLSDRLVLFAMAAQAFGIILPHHQRRHRGHYLVNAFHADQTGPLGDVFFWAALVYATGRLAGCALMRFVSPVRLLAIFAIAGLACSLIAAVSWTMIRASPSWRTSSSPRSVANHPGSCHPRQGTADETGNSAGRMGGAIGTNLYVAMTTAWPSVPTHMGMLIPALCCVAVFGFALAFARQEAKAAAGKAAPVSPNIAALPS